jgi:hypothetical protein
MHATCLAGPIELIAPQGRRIDIEQAEEGRWKDG